MLRLALLFFIIALIAGMFNFMGVAFISAELARVFFFLFIVLAVLALIGGLAWRTPPV